MIGDHIDEIIMFGVGLWATLVGYGYLPMPGGDTAARPAWVSQIVKHFSWLGPLLMVIALFLAFASAA